MYITVTFLDHHCTCHWLQLSQSQLFLGRIVNTIGISTFPAGLNIPVFNFFKQKLHLTPLPLSKLYLLDCYSPIPTLDLGFLWHVTLTRCRYVNMLENYFHLIINTWLELLDSSPIVYYLKHALSSGKVKSLFYHITVNLYPQHRIPNCNELLNKWKTCAQERSAWSVNYKCFVNTVCGM